MRYGYDWNLGDKVSVVADQTTAVATVTEVAISVTDAGIYVYATVGEPDIASDETRTNTVQNNQEDRISNLERNEPTGGGSGGGGGSVGYYGSFYDMTDQPLASTTAAQAVAIGTTAEAVGISITSGNRVLFANAGTYSLTFSIQITNVGTTVAKSVFWVKKNGVDYADSATELDLQSRKGAGNPNRQVITINYVATAAAGDYVQVFWAGDSLNLTVEALPAGSSPVYPAVPSIILTATQVGNSGLVVSPNAPTSTGVLWLDTDEPSNIPVPTGGTANQVLAKIDSTNYNTQWITPPSVPAGGSVGQFLRKQSATDYDATWAGIAASEITSGALNYARMPSGSILQVLSAKKTDTAATSTATFSDIGGLSISITPKSTSSKILVFADVKIGASGDQWAQIKILRNSSEIYILGAARFGSNTDTRTEAGSVLDSPNTTSATIYKLSWANILAPFVGGTSYINRRGFDAGVQANSSITVMEIAG
jgi:hypothetical protein